MVPKRLRHSIAAFARGADVEAERELDCEQGLARAEDPLCAVWAKMPGAWGIKANGRPRSIQQRHAVRDPSTPTPPHDIGRQPAQHEGAVRRSGLST